MDVIHVAGLKPGTSIFLLLAPQETINRDYRFSIDIDCRRQQKQNKEIIDFTWQKQGEFLASCTHMVHFFQAVEFDLQSEYRCTDFLNLKLQVGNYFLIDFDCIANTFYIVEG